MVFKPFNVASTVPATPDQLFLQLSRRTLQTVAPHQQRVLQDYVASSLTTPDVALQLPTGSGKTLVGILIAEWRRRKYSEKIVYLCPTKQLVFQVADEAEKKYGVSVTAFTGGRKAYTPAMKNAYNTADKIAITTYSSLFNSNPFFADADIIILDDAHACENYVANMWSVELSRKSDEAIALFDSLVGLVRPSLQRGDLARLSAVEESALDAAWVDKLPTPVFVTYIDRIKDLLDTYFHDDNVNYSWMAIRDNLHACQFYMSTSSFLIRPLIPPTWAHPAFANAKQRIYMSATLGLGGDLERVTGRSPIKRQATPAGFEMQGVGRRFFLFPEASLERNASIELCLRLMLKAGRSLTLVPSDPVQKLFKSLVEEKLKIPVFSARDIENGKSDFLAHEKAAVIVANRYDGIDFPDAQCRLLIIEGLPRATNLQERFLVARMGANVLLADRIKTRVIQAVGRCTRSLVDYSAVVVLGSSLADYLLSPKNRRHLHPSLQSEIEFGSTQSRNITAKDFLDLATIFLDHKADWESVDQQIVAAASGFSQIEIPLLAELTASAVYEINWQKKLWQSDFVEALSSAEMVLGTLTSSELRGYRALWNYLAGSSALLAAKGSDPALSAKSRGYFATAKGAASGIPWLVELSRHGLTEVSETEGVNNAILKQVENIAKIIETLGVYHDMKLAKREKEIIEGLKDAKTFEIAHQNLGELLGFSSAKIESEGSPDPWWLIDKYCFVFEDYVGADAESALGVNKARQLESHPNWILANVEEAKDAEIIPVLISHINDVKTAALPHLLKGCFWRTSELKLTAAAAVSLIRELRTTYYDSEDLAWRAQAVEKLQSNKLDVLSLRSMLLSAPVAKSIREVP